MFRGLAALVLLGICGVNTARADYHVATAQQLQNALTLAAASSVSNNIYVTNGYYTGNFNFNSSNVNSLTILNEPGVASGQIVIDSGGTGSSMSITASASPFITVQGMTFMRNCGSTSLGGLQITGGNTAILVSGCQFLSPTNSSGIGLLLQSGISATVTNCTAAGSKTGSGGTGIYISGITNSVNVQNCMFTTNTSGGLYIGGWGGIFGLNASVVAVTSCNFSGNSGGAGLDLTQPQQCGGGACCNGISVTLSGNTFTGNSASGYSATGGGAFCSGTIVTLAGNTFTGNFASGSQSYAYGGGVFCGGAVVPYSFTAGSVRLLGNTFTSNSVSGGSGNSGGGAYCYCTNIVMSGNTFTGNFGVGGTGGGGGAACSSVQYSAGVGGNLTLSNNTFTGNSIIGSATTAPGGGAYCSSSSATTNPMIISGNIFQQNTAVSGGGLYASGPTINLLDNLVVNNAVTNTSSQGGGIWVDASSNLFMINNTVTGNTSAQNGGGVAYIVTGTVELLNVYNNIIWGNLATSSGGDVYLSGTGKKKVFNFNDADSYYGVWDIAQNDIDASPQFFNPVNGDYHTQSTSPCANAGTNGAPSQPLTDLDGNSRTNSAGLVDMGCYEFNTTAFHPADTDTNSVITGTEYNAYAAAWKNGQTWSNAPTVIPANYLTRAGYLMTNGGAYTNDGSARPVNWKIHQ